MTARRLRDLPDLDELYPTPHDHTLYGLGHHARIEMSKLMLKTFVPKGRVVADLSCGNGALARHIGWPNTILGDYAPGYTYQGRLEDTIEQLATMVDLYICSETLEHLDEPWQVLGRIREWAGWLFVSTPLECWDDSNAEHVWAWDREGIEEMFATSGWEPQAFATLDSRTWGEPYLYGMWVCS
jgi:hypothetical protein